MQDLGLTTILWRGKWLVLASLVVAVGLAVVLTKQATKVYQATALLQVNSPETGVNSADVLQRQQASQGLAKTYATVITSRSFLDQIRPQVAHGTLTTGDLQARVSAAPVLDTGLISEQVTGPSPESARSLASDVASAFLASVRKSSKERFSQQQADLQSRVDSLSAQIQQLLRKQQSPGVQEQLTSLRASRTALTDQLAQIISSEAQQGGAVSLTAPPTASANPISPRPLLNLVAGFVLGLLLGCALAWLRDRLDRGLHSSGELEEIVGAPVLASIPLRRRFSADDPVLGEAYDVMRANLAFLSLDGQLQVLTFSSYNPREGKTSTVEGLAYAAVRGGMSVLMIDGDVRTRTLSTRLGYGDAPGLTTVMIGAADLDDAVVRPSPGLAVLPAGPTPPNPPSLLSSARMRELLSDLRAQYDLIVIDSPPVAHLADPSILAAISDGVVVVARVGVSERRDLAAATANLRKVPTPIVGTVLLERRSIDQTYYPAIVKGTPGAEPPAEAPEPARARPEPEPAADRF